MSRCNKTVTYKYVIQSIKVGLDMLKNGQNCCVKKCREIVVEGHKGRGRPRKNWGEVEGILVCWGEVGSYSIEYTA